MIPLISFDAVVNVYLTIIFLLPLKSEQCALPVTIETDSLRPLHLQEYATDAGQLSSQDPRLQNFWRSGLHAYKQYSVRLALRKQQSWVEY